MICTSNRIGHDCTFQTKKGCAAGNGGCQPVDDRCDGCGKVVNGGGKDYCRVYVSPTAKWQYGSCPTATHINKAVEEARVNKVNPLKASKRAAKR